MFNFGSGPIIVTGASGWVGRTILDQLAQLLPQEELHTRLRAFSSQAGLIHLADGQSIATQPLTSLPALAEQESCSFLLHAAFLTPDRCEELGRETYTAINRSITQLVESAIRASPRVRVVHFSSGAAAFVETNRNVSSPSTQIYGALKLEEERRLQAIAPTLVLRIYALSGRHIRDPRRYALGDFIGQALQGRPIQVQSQNPVVRGYVHAGCLAELATRWVLSSLSPPPDAVNAVTHEINLVDLARCIAAVLGNHSVRVPEQITQGASIYTASPSRFLDMLRLLEVETPSLEYQILDTARADFSSGGGSELVAENPDRMP